MILTPTHHVLERYAVHHDATFIPTELTCPDYTVGGQTIPSPSASASKAADGAIHLSPGNLHTTKPLTLQVALPGPTPKTSKDACPPPRP